MNQVSDILKRTRESKGWNKSQMARELDISSQLYGQYETGAKKPGADFFINWKQKFGSDLLETKVSHETKNLLEEPFAAYIESRRSLERTLENLTADKIKSTAIIEELVGMLKANYPVKPDMSMFTPPGNSASQTLTTGKKSNSKKP